MGNPWPRGPNAIGGYQLDARVATLQEQALGALTNHAQIQNAPPQRLLDDLSSFQRVLFTNHRVRALSDAVREGTTPLPDPDPPLERARAAGQGRVRARLRSMPRRPRPVDLAGAGGSIPRHLEPVSASRRYGLAGSLRVSRRARRDSRAMPGRTSITLPNGTKIRRTSSDPGRALLTGFVGGVLRPGRLEQVRRPRAARDQQDRAVLPQQQRRHARGRGRSLHRVLQAGQCEPGLVPPVASTDGIHFDRQPTPEERESLLAYLKTL